MFTLLPIRTGMILRQRNVIFPNTMLVPLRIPSIPNEALNELVLILLGNNNSSSLDDVSDVFDEFLTRRREFVNIDRCMPFGEIQSRVDLRVGREVARTECLNDAIKFKFTLDVCVLLCWVRWRCYRTLTFKYFNQSSRLPVSA